MVYRKSPQIRNTDFCESAPNPIPIRDCQLSPFAHVVVGDTGNENLRGKIGEKHRKPLVDFSPWGQLSDEERIRVAMETLLVAEGYTVFTINVNVHRKLSKRLHGGASLHYVRDELRRILSTADRENRLYFLLVMEKPPDDTKVHFHGSLILPAWKATKSFIRKLTERIRGSPMCRKYREIGSNKAVLIKDSYRRRDDPPHVERPIDIGWADYMTKNYRKGGKYVMSRELNQLSKKYLEKQRKKSFISKCKENQ